MANEMIKGARVLLECLSRLGIEEIFGYPGGAVIPIYIVSKILSIILQDMNKEQYTRLTVMQDHREKLESVLQHQVQGQQIWLQV